MNKSVSFAQISVVLGGKATAAVLLYLEAYEKCCARQVADAFRLKGALIQKQLDKFQRVGLIDSERVGKTKVYRIVDVSPFAAGLKITARSALSVLDEDEFLKIFSERRRPRRPGKPLWIRRRKPTMASIILNDEARDQFIQMMTDPPKPNEVLIELIKKHTKKGAAKRELTLAKRDAEIFLAALENLSGPNPALKKAFKKYGK